MTPRENFIRLQADYRALLSNKESLSKSVQVKSEALVLHKQADVVLEELVKALNSTSISTIEHLVGKGLKTIFEAPFDFKIRTTTKRGNLQYEMFLVENGEERSIINSYGGGVIAVISILLRIITVLIVEPSLKRVLVLDESLAQLSKQYVPNAAQFFKQLGKDLGFKIIMVSHDPTFIEYADKVYEITKGDNYTAEIREL